MFVRSIQPITMIVGSTETIVGVVIEIGLVSHVTARVDEYVKEIPTPF